MLPWYLHDCDRCVFLGPYRCYYGDYDLYWCNGWLLARFGCDSNDYLCGMSGTRNPPLLEAVRRASRLGLSLKLACNTP